MSNNLIGELSLLKLEKKYLKRELDNNWYNKIETQRLFNKIMEVNKKIEYVKFKLELERKIKKWFWLSIRAMSKVRIVL